MGAETACTLRFQGKTSAGRALLETDALVFRGRDHLSIPYRNIRGLAVSNGALAVTFTGGVAVFVLGPSAGAWAEAIRNPKGLLDKLGVKAGTTVVVLQLSDPDFSSALAARGVRIVPRLQAGAALVFLGVADRLALSRLRIVARKLRPDGAVWVVAPKGSPSVREADVLAAGREAGMVDIKVVRFSETHTAHKFVIPASRRPRRS